MADTTLHSPFRYGVPLRWPLRWPFLWLFLGACATPASTPREAIRRATLAVDDTRLENAADDVGNWLSDGQTYAEDRFSRLDEVSTDNVGALGPAWTFGTGMRGGIEATPLVVDGTMWPG